MLNGMPQPQSARDMLHQFVSSPAYQQDGQVLRFTGVDGQDVYNPSVPFQLDGRCVMAGRVEKRDSEDSTTMLFEQQADGSFALIEGAPVFPGLQDPFVTTIRGDIVLGGIHALWREDGSLITYHADFYRLHGLGQPEFLFQGPEFMKDIRLLDMQDGRIAVFTRPQGAAMKPLHRIAAIGFVMVNSLQEINAELIANAPLMQWHFLANEWGGPNQLHLLSNGLIGMIGHISWGEMIDGVHFLHYHSFAQAIDPETRGATPVKLIACRSMFKDAPAKAPRLQDVCFTSGIQRLENGRAFLYSGLSDACIGKVEIEDPFLEYEALK